MSNTSWKKVILSDVATCRNGAGIKQFFFNDIGVPLARVSDFTNNSIDMRNCLFVEFNHAKKWEDYRLKSGDVVVATVGSWPPNWSSVVGKAIRVPKKAEGAIQNQNSCGVFAKKDLADQRFLFYLLKSDNFIQYAANSAGGSANQARLPVGKLEKFCFEIPPLSTQHAIARILGSLDDKIELNRQMNETLEAMARAIFQSWFVDFDPVQAKAEGRDTGLPPEVAALFPDGFEEVDGREVPRGWGVGTLEEIADNIRRPINPVQVDPETPYIGLEHMPQHSIGLPDWGSASTVESGKFAFRKNEFLFGKLRPYFHKVGIASIDGVCSTDILVVKSKNDPWSSYVLCCISSNEFVEFANQGSDGTRMPRSSWSAMKKYPIIIPPENILTKFNSSMLPVFEKINVNIHESRTLAQIRDALLPKLMSGQLRVDNNSS